TSAAPRVPAPRRSQRRRRTCSHPTCGRDPGPPARAAAQRVGDCSLTRVHSRVCTAAIRARARTVPRRLTGNHHTRPWENSVTVNWTDADRRAVDTLRVLAADAVEKVGNGHPGTAISLAPAAYLLYQNVMRHDPSDSRWLGRDRFVLSA